MSPVTATIITMIKELNQATLVPLGLAVVIIGTVAMWVADTRSELRAHSDIIEELKKSNDASYKLVSEINSRLSRMEWQLEKTRK